MPTYWLQLQKRVIWCDFSSVSFVCTYPFTSVKLFSVFSFLVRMSLLETLGFHGADLAKSEGHDMQSLPDRAGSSVHVRVHFFCSDVIDTVLLTDATLALRPPPRHTPTCISVSITSSYFCGFYQPFSFECFITWTGCNFYLWQVEIFDQSACKACRARCLKDILCLWSNQRVAILKHCKQQM